MPKICAVSQSKPCSEASEGTQEQGDKIKPFICLYFPLGFDGMDTIYVHMQKVPLCSILQINAQLIVQTHQN